jgi:hypothetical protein
MDIPFEKYGHLEHFIDGHVPENISSTTSQTKLVKYNDEPTTPSVQIYSNVLPPSLCQQIYNHTVKSDIPWGTYVTKEEALNCSLEETTGVDATLCTDGNNAFTPSDMIQILATRATHHFIFKANDNSQSEQIHQVIGKRLRPENDARIHGVQLWALPATKGSSVPYHIDYAEYIRYTENVIVTPLYAGTVQCTSHKITGGTFAVHQGGLAHYQEYGYKGRNKDDKDRMAGWTDNNVGEVCMSNGWVSIPYKLNQGILHSGTLPHLSGHIIDIDKGKRVIVGFNVFGHDVGEFVRKCPEHSDKFRKMVKLHRSLRKVKCESTANGINIEDVKKNKALTKFLVLAKRQREKDQWIEARKAMTKWLLDQIHADKHDDTEISNVHVNIGIAVSDLLIYWENENHHPTKDDLHIQIHRLVKEGRLQLATSDTSDHNGTLIGLDAIVLYQHKTQS